MATHVATYTPGQITGAEAPAATTAYDVSTIYRHSYQVKADNRDGTVIVGLEGSMDDTNYFELPLTSTAVTNVTLSSNRATVAAGSGSSTTTFVLQAEAKVKWIRLKWITNNSGNTATLDSVYFGGN